MRFIEIRGADQTVIIDGVCLKLNFNLKKNYSTVYFDASISSGFVEYINSKGHVIDNLDEFAAIIEAFETKIETKKKTEYTLRIVPDDRLVTIDDLAFEFDFDIDQNYHAVQWDGENGFIETKQGMNLTLVDVDEFADIIAAHAALKKNQDKEKEAAEKEAAKPENVAKRDIVALEQEITPRRVREALLTEEGKTWLAAKEAEIEALRSKVKSKK